LGRTYWATNQPDRAEPALLKARDLAPAVPETWVTLVQFLAATGRKDRALAEVEAAQRRLTDKSAALALAACHEAVGHADRAGELYQAALQAGGDDVAALRGAAGFYLRTGRTAEVEALLRRLGGQRGDREAARAAQKT